MAGSGLAGGDYLRRRKLLHDIHECGHWLRYCGLGDDHGHRPLERGGGSRVHPVDDSDLPDPLFFIWSNTCRYTLLRQLRTRGQRIRNVAVVLLAGLLVWAPIRLMEKQQKGSKSDRRGYAKLRRRGG